MLRIDAGNFPVLSTKKALLVVDAQNEFLAKDGALLIESPADLVQRLERLVQEFRPYGPIVWSRSEFEAVRKASSDTILVSNVPTVRGKKIGRRPRSAAQDQQGDEIPLEAFLSHAPGLEASMKPGTPGVDLHPQLQILVEKRDINVTKSHYSAFQSPNLVQRLRMKLVTELYICGSLSSIGVHATAIDAASHGFDITVIEDCCGYKSAMRHHSALNSIANKTGCDVISAENLLNALKSKQKPRGLSLSALRVNSVEKPESDSASTAEGPDQAADEKLNDTDGNGEGECADKESGPTINGAIAALGKPLSSSNNPVPNTASTQSALSELHSSLSNISPRQGPSSAPPRQRRSMARTARQPSQADLMMRQLQAMTLEPHMFSPDDDLYAGMDEPDESLSGGDSSKLVQPQNEHRSPKNVLDSENVDKRETKTEVCQQGQGPNVLSTPTAESAGTIADESENLPEVPTCDSAPIAKPSEAEAMSASNSGKSVQRHPEAVQDHAKDETQEIEPQGSGPLCEGDTRVIYNILPAPLSDGIFEKVKDEVDWQRMSHQGGEVPRLVAVQGEVGNDDSFPIYRHPADESPPLLPFSSTVRAIKEVVESRVGHELNHALVQLYRDGSDYISEHSDKTLDIVKESFIVNVSLGAERTMILRTKRASRPRDLTATQVEALATEGAKRDVQRARLPHNSMCQMGLVTNERWLHAIRQDKRLDREKTPAELAYQGGRISLTFRKIGTFLNKECTVIWGQGATSKTRSGAKPVVNGQTPEAIKMLQAFGRENQSTVFDWDEFYGAGFDVLHISASPRLFTSSDPVANMRVQLMLAEHGIQHAKGSVAPVTDRKDKAHGAVGEGLLIKFVDSDAGKSTVVGDMAIMLYIERFYGARDELSKTARSDFARQLSRFQQAMSLGTQMRYDVDAEALTKELEVWEKSAGEASFIAGDTIGLADFAAWPVFHEMIGRDDLATVWSTVDKLKAYYHRVKDSDAGRKVLGAVLGK